MRVVILTSVDRGFASICLPHLVKRAGVDVAMVVLASRAPSSRWRRMKRVVKKMMAIGPRGAMNGLRMRRWYTDDVAERLAIEPIDVVCAAHGVRFERTPMVSHDRTVALFRAAGADLGLSLGNAYISPRVFNSPRLGMVNVHHELLPDFQGAQSVLWQLHERSRITGFTIHRLSQQIDAGDILLREEMPIVFGRDLHETVVSTYAALLSRSAARLPDVVADFERFAANATPQSQGRRFTTPSWAAFKRMVREHERLRRDSR